MRDRGRAKEEAFSISRRLSKRGEAGGVDREEREREEGGREGGKREEETRGLLFPLPLAPRSPDVTRRKPVEGGT